MNEPNEVAEVKQNVVAATHVAQEVRLAPIMMPNALAICENLANSEMVPTDLLGKPKLMLARWQGAHEIGMNSDNILACLRGVFMVHNRISAESDTLLAIASSRPDFEYNEDSFDEATMTATCTIMRRGRKPITRSFSKKDAETAGLWNKKGTWTNHPKDMLMHRAYSRALRKAFPETMAGVYSTDEAANFEPRTVAAKVVKSDGAADLMQEANGERNTSLDAEDLDSQVWDIIEPHLNAAIAFFRHHNWIPRTGKVNYTKLTERQKRNIIARPDAFVDEAVACANNLPAEETKEGE